MKKFTLALCIMLLAYTVEAQTQFGLHADAILASQSIKSSGVKISSDHRFSWRAGIVANTPINAEFSFMPQLNIISKGSAFNFDDSKTKFKLTYLELPLNFVYNSKGFFAGAGPVVSYGLGGKATLDDGTTVQNVDVIFDGKKEADVTDDNAHMKALEWGANILAGYKLASGLFFKANYNFAFSNSNPDADPSMKSDYFGFGIGYFFSRTGANKK